MSIADQINRISIQKNTIRDKLRAMGLIGATESPNIDGLASKINGIVVYSGENSINVLEGNQKTMDAGYYKAPVTFYGVTNDTADLQRIKAFEDKITPTKSEQVFTVPDEYLGFGSFVVKAIGDEYKDTSDANVTADQVLANKIFYNGEGRGVGTMKNRGAVTAVLDEATGTYTIPEGYHDGKGFVTFYPAELDVTPSKDPQTFNANGELYVKVNVAKIPDAYQDVTQVDATAANVLAGKKIVAKDGSVVVGTMKNDGTKEVVVSALDASDDMGVMFDANIGAYVEHITVYLHPDLEAALAEI